VDILADGEPLALDNGQHILIGAYECTLQLMQKLGVAPDTHLLRLPLRLRFPNGDGLAFADFSRWPAWLRPTASVQAAIGIASARGWPWHEKASLLRLALRWQAAGFQCAPGLSVSALCQGLAAGPMTGLIEPLCVSALNTPAERASAQVFLRVLQDALFGAAGASDLLLPSKDLGALLPDAALRWLTARGHSVQTGVRVTALSQHAAGWRISTEAPGQALHPAGKADTLFDAVLLACPPTEAARLVQTALPANDLPAPHGPADAAIQRWLALARDLRHEPIATVYAQVPPAARGAGAGCLPQPLLALVSSASEPAQFVFDRGQLGARPGLLAFVVSASQGDKTDISAKVLAQGRRQLGLPLALVQTIIEKRATFACTPDLQRPAALIAPGLLACGDYIDGPYPATLEGAVRSGLAAARLLAQGDGAPAGGH
jgi:hypothetical protein